VSHKYEDIHLPKDTSIAAYIGFLALGFGFAMVWYIYWLAILCFLGIVASLVYRLSRKDEMQIITAKQVEQIELEFGKQQI
jgi:cytochrome o ubiquinol oxidase subunit 1